MIVGFVASAFALAAAAGSGSAGDQTQPSAPAKAPAPAAEPPAAPAAPAGEPERITVQHILIAFTGSPASKKPRTQEEARKLAYELLERARKGEDFDALVKEHSEDRYPGTYSMVNNGVQPGPGEFARGRMVAAFGDTGFPLKVGEVGIADFDPKKSPYGWHIVKRLK
jgi:foldase protein PrsA